MNRLMCVTALIGVLASGPAGFVLAHDGHTHTVMGLVWKVSPEQVQVKTKDGKTETILITDQTAISRGKTLANLASVMPGERVVVDVGAGAKPLTARSIKVGVPAPAASTATQK